MRVDRHVGINVPWTDGVDLNIPLRKLYGESADEMADGGFCRAVLFFFTDQFVNSVS